MLGFFIVELLIATGQFPMAGAILLGLGLGHLILWRADKFLLVLKYALDRAAAAANYCSKLRVRFATQAIAATMAAMAAKFAGLSPAPPNSPIPCINAGLLPKIFSAYL